MPCPGCEGNGRIELRARSGVFARCPYCLGAARVTGNVPLEPALLPKEWRAGVTAFRRGVAETTSQDAGDYLMKLLEGLPDSIEVSDIIEGEKRADVLVELQRLVDECNAAMRRLRAWLARDRGLADPMGDACLFGDRMRLLLMTAAYRDGIKGTYRRTEQARRKMIAHHAAQAPALAKRESKIEQLVRTRKAVGDTRAEILDKTWKKFGVNRSTIEKKPNIRRLLPKTRRTPRI